MKKFILLVIILTLVTGCKDKPKKHEYVSDQQRAETPVQTEPQEESNDEDDSEYATVKVTCAAGTFTTNKEISFGGDTTTITLQSGKRVWIGTGIVAEEQ